MVAIEREQFADYGEIITPKVRKQPSTRLNPTSRLLILCAFYIYCTFCRI